MSATVRWTSKNDAHSPRPSFSIMQTKLSKPAARAKARGKPMGKSNPTSTEPPSGARRPHNRSRRVVGSPTAITAPLCHSPLAPDQRWPCGASADVCPNHSGQLLRPARRATLFSLNAETAICRLSPAALRLAEAATAHRRRFESMVSTSPREFLARCYRAVESFPWDQVARWEDYSPRGAAGARPAITGSWRGRRRSAAPPCRFRFHATRRLPSWDGRRHVAEADGAG